MTPMIFFLILAKALNYVSTTNTIGTAYKDWSDQQRLWNQHPTTGNTNITSYLTVKKNTEFMRY